MGLDYSYRLFFHESQIWEVLQGVVAMADPLQPGIDIRFPDKIITLPFESFMRKDKPYEYYEKEFSFATSLNFEEDDALIDYITARDHLDEDRSPPDDVDQPIISIGFIYLDVRRDFSDYDNPQDGKDVVLFDFGTTGTRMSMLFEYSTSIRNAFTSLLRTFHGICGIFNRELEGEVFLFKDRPIPAHYCDTWILPGEIARELAD